MDLTVQLTYKREGSNGLISEFFIPSQSQTVLNKVFNYGPNNPALHILLVLLMSCEQQSH